MYTHLPYFFIQLVLIELDKVLQKKKKVNTCSSGSKYGFCSAGLLTSASVMDTRLVSMVGCRAIRPLSCRDIFLSEALWEPVVLGGPDLKPFRGVKGLEAMDMVATMSASSAWCSASSSDLQAVSALMVVVSDSLTAGLCVQQKQGEQPLIPWGGGAAKRRAQKITMRLNVALNTRTYSYVTR